MNDVDKMIDYIDYLELELNKYIDMFNEIVESIKARQQ